MHLNLKCGIIVFSMAVSFVYNIQFQQVFLFQIENCYTQDPKWERLGFYK